MDVFVTMMNDDEKERSYLFNSDFTHVGISCGCDAIHEERCCFAFGKDVQDKSGVDTWDMLAKQGFNCKLGDNYDDQVIKVDSYKDPNGPNEPAEKEADPDPPAPKGTGTYEDISKAVFDSYKALV